MNRRTLFVLTLAIVVFRVESIEVDVDELREHIDREIEFTNYEGEHDLVSTAEEIKAIGRLLAIPEGRVLLKDKYSLIHAVDSQDAPTRDADIVSFDRAAGVDHIDNVRRIIAGYLEEAYGYAPSDAATLAIFITLYNAIFRGEIAFFSQRFNERVIQNISKENAGLSTLYSEWAGATKLIIPLTERAQKGKLTALDTTELTEDEVIEEIKKTEDRGVDVRKDMIDIKEREVEEMKNEVLEEIDAIEETKRALEEEKKELEESKKELEKIKSELEMQVSVDPDKSEQVEEITESKETFDDTDEATTEAGVEKESIEEAGRQKEQIEELEQKIDRQEAEVQKLEQEVIEAEGEISTVLEKIEAKETEVEGERQQIKEDETELDRQPVTTALKIEEEEQQITLDDESEIKILTEMVYYLVHSADRTILSIIDPVTQSVLAQSSLAHISGRNFYFFNEKILVNGQEDSADAASHLVLLHPQTLAVVVRSADEVIGGSHLLIQSNVIYTIVSKNGRAYVGKFDAQLGLTALSNESVLNVTTLAIFENDLYATSPEGKILILDKETLGLRQQVQM